MPHLFAYFTWSSQATLIAALAFALVAEARHATIHAGALGAYI